MSAVDIGQVAGRIVETDAAAAAEAQRLLDGKTKPPRSLGRLEDLVCQLAAIRGYATPRHAPGEGDRRDGRRPRRRRRGRQRVPAGGDRPDAAQLRSAAARRSTCWRARPARASSSSTWASRARWHAAPEIRACRIGAGTANLARGPAMTRAQARAALAAGAALADELARDGVGLLGIGEMGIANTTAASALAAVFTGAPPEEVTGRGTGIDDATFRRKVDVVRRGIEINRPDAGDAVDALAKVGGFEIAGLAGVVLGAAAARLPVVVDGFIASVAALAAVRLAPLAAGYLIASHRSVEAGHRLVLQALGARPLLDLDLRLGEGTGAALAMPLVDAALAIAAEMATFESAGVSGG